MVDFKKDELLKIAAISGLQLDPEEISTFSKQLQILLSYTSELEQIPQKPTFSAQHNINVFRDDRTVLQTDSQPLLALAPKREDTYFVVPKMISEQG